MVVTGTEPQSTDLTSDPSLTVVEQLIEATSDRLRSTIFSCFSAHAAINILYSIPRDMLGVKHSGVFRHHVCDKANALTKGLDSEVWVPHSRWNSINQKKLATAGVLSLILERNQDWHLASSADGLKQIFVQGHPEYRTDMLFREYRRDVRRFLAGETYYYPTVPSSYFDEKSFEQLLDFQKKATRCRDPKILESFPGADVVGRLRNTWEAAAQIFIKNWLVSVAEGRIA